MPGCGCSWLQRCCDPIWGRMADSSGAKANLRRKAKRAHERGKRDMVRALAAAAPKDTGQLSRAVQVGPTTGTTTLTARIDLQPRRNPGPADNYLVAAVNEHGRGPVVIRPRRARALRFQSGGQVRFARVVRQPARQGRPWFYPQMRRWGDTVRRAWRVS